MDWYWILILALVMVLLVLPLLIGTLIIPHFVFDAICARKKPQKWSRNTPSGSHPGIVMMWEESLRFREVYKDSEQEIEATTQDGFHLKGLYYDFGSDTAVLILGGRPETCIYSLFYAYPYAEAGYNVCAFDPRAHGESDGVYSGCGYAEQWDYLAFAKELIHRGIRRIILHGICVGSSAATFLAGSKDCPKEVSGLVTDGLFIHYYEQLKKRIRKNRGPVYPTVWIFNYKIKKLYGIDCKKVGPLSEIPNVRIPCLMMASKEDLFSLPRNTQLLFDRNGSSDKKLVWFEHGPHSHLRRVDPALYDKSVLDFVAHLPK